MGIAYLHGNGGGSVGGLGFEIVGGTSAPSKPKDNTIWVNTSQKITSWDFSATEPHRISNNRNLLVYPYYSTSGTTNGITFTANSDGTVKANGTATADTYFRFVAPGVEGKYILPAGTYTLSGAISDSDAYLEVGYSYDGIDVTYAGTAADTYKTFTFTSDVCIVLIGIVVKSGKKLDDVVFKPQFEKGPNVTSFMMGDATGQVWISTGLASNVSFNALKKNGIQVYPIQAYQWNGTTWVDKATKSYQLGKWVDWWNGEFYNSGVFSSPYPHTSFKTPSGCAIEYKADHISMSTAANSISEIYEIFGPVDLSSYNSLESKQTGYSKYNIYADLFVANTANGRRKNNLAITEVEVEMNTSEVLRLDISKISDRRNMYVYAGFSTEGRTFESVRTGMKLHYVKAVR